MSLPISLHGNEFYEHLREFRNDALTESHWSGRRRHLGGFTFGVACARWWAEEGGCVDLIDEGLLLSGSPIVNPLPTTLRTFNSPGAAGFEVVTFEMELDDVGYINVYRNLTSGGSFSEILKAMAYKRADRKHGLSEPTDEQRELLYAEMQRGASGLYAIKTDLEADD